MLQEMAIDIRADLMRRTVGVDRQPDHPALESCAAADKPNSVDNPIQKDTATTRQQIFKVFIALLARGWVTYDNLECLDEKWIL